MKNLLLFCVFACNMLYAANVENLRCEYQSHPLCVDVASPHLSWVMVSSARGDVQSACQVIVASSEALLAKNKGDMWDSGKMFSEQSIHVKYQGRPLQSGTPYFWKVKIWDKAGRPSGWSKPASWSMGLLSEKDWGNAQWIAYKDGEQWKKEWKLHKDRELHDVTDIGSSWPWFTGKDSTIFTLYEMADPAYDPSPLFRKEFPVNKKIGRANLYICGLGYYEAFINGARVGDQVLDPAWTNYEQRSMYVGYEVTELLKSGDNAIGVMLGRGQYNPLCNDIWRLSQSAWIDQPKLIALLRIEYTDGSLADVITDETWKTSGGPVVYDDTRHGELYDARLEQAGWNLARFGDSGWKAASVVPWKAHLVSQMIPPVRCFEPLTPVRKLDRNNGITVYDVGKNIAGWARVKVRGASGSKVLVEYCETPSDNELVENLTPWRFKHDIPEPYASFYDKAVNIRQQNGYILNGKGAETFECHFSYKGFQFIRITADDGVTIEQVEGIPVHTDVPVTGHFSCSNPVINKIQENSVISLLNNYHSIATDCPHREKQGWTADNYLSAQAAMYNFDMAAFYSKWISDLAGTQGSTGGLCTVAPSTGYDMNISTAWPAAIVLVPLDIYRFYADRRPMEDHYEVMHRFAESSLQRQVEGKPEIINEVLGDWLAPLMEISDSSRSNTMAPPEGHRLYGTAAHFLVVNRLAEISRILGKEKEADELVQWSKKIANRFNETFFDAKTNVYHGENPVKYRQSANIVPLEYGLTPEASQPVVLEHLLQDIHEKGDRLGTGFLGTPALMEYLSKVKPELAYTIATQPRYPGWGYMIQQGANAMWESWDGYDSRNHTPFCLISGYFFKYLAGIQADPALPGFKHIIINPSVENDLSFADAFYDCMYGRIVCNWKREKEHFTLHVSIPANTTATVYIPTTSAAGITESGQAVNKVKNVKYLGMEGGKAVYEIGSGSYRFQF